MTIAAVANVTRNGVYGVNKAQTPLVRFVVDCVAYSLSVDRQRTAYGFIHIFTRWRLMTFFAVLSVLTVN